MELRRRGLSRDLLLRDLAYRLQADAEGGVSKATRRRLRTLAQAFAETGRVATEHGTRVRPGTRLVRAWHGRTYLVTATENGFTYEGETYGSLRRGRPPHYRRALVWAALLRSAAC